MINYFENSFFPSKQITICFVEEQAWLVKERIRKGILWVELIKFSSDYIIRTDTKFDSLFLTLYETFIVKSVLFVAKARI